MHPLGFTIQCQNCDAACAESVEKITASYVCCKRTCKKPQLTSEEDHREFAGELQACTHWVHRNAEVRRHSGS